MSIDFKSKQTQLIGAAIVALAAIILALALVGGGSKDAQTPATTTAEAPATPEQALEAAEEASTQTAETTIPLATEEEEVLTPVALEQSAVSEALSERSIGKADAPATIVEYSSLSCSHCGAFHKNVFKNLKETLIDTGKARLVISDFPLNGPALHASMVARCLPEDKFFDYIQLLFETQDQWAYSEGYKKYLKQNAQLAGLSAQQFENCINSEPLRAGILAMVEKGQKEQQINATPTFVINGKVKVQGERGLEDFQKAITEAEKAK
jgi:protein-disulfide isomerase